MPIMLVENHSKTMDTVIEVDPLFCYNNLYKGFYLDFGVRLCGFGLSATRALVRSCINVE